MANCPAVITCTDVMADEHPELVIAYMKAMIKVGRWANDNKRAAAYILNRQTFYLDAEHTYEGIKHVDMVPSLNAQNIESIKIGKDFMFSHGYIKHDFDVDEWARPEFLEKAAEEVLKEEWERRSWSKLPAGRRARGRGRAARLAPTPQRRAADHDRPRPRRPTAPTNDPCPPAGPARRTAPWPMTALQMVMEASAQIGHVSPMEAQAEIAAGSGRRAGHPRAHAEWETHIAGAVQVPRGILERGLPTPRALATSRSSIRHAGPSCTAALARGLRSPA